MPDMTVYLVDLSKFRKMLMEPMPIAFEPPPARPLLYLSQVPFLPQMQIPSTILCTTTDFDDPWKFHYLFPLGKRGYRRG